MNLKVYFDTLKNEKRIVAIRVGDTSILGAIVQVGDDFVELSEEDGSHIFPYHAISSVRIFSDEAIQKILAAKPGTGQA